MRTKTGKIEIESNGNKVWIYLNGKKFATLSIQEFDCLLSASLRMDTNLTDFFNK